MKASWGKETTCAHICMVAEGGLRRGPRSARKVLEAMSLGGPIDASSRSTVDAESKKGSLERNEK